MFLVIELRNLQLHQDVSVNKLRQGHGETILQILSQLSTQCLQKRGIVLKQPVFKNEEAVEEAQVDADAEIIVETFESDDDEEDDEPLVHKMNHAFGAKKQEKIENAAQPDAASLQVNMEEWKMEIERVTPLLKINLSNDNKDWRIHMEHFKNSFGNVQSQYDEAQSALEKFKHEMKALMEKIANRESYLATHFEQNMAEHKTN